MRNNIRQRRGIALFMVIAMVAAASVMGWAMLSSTSVQSQLSKNVSASASALNLAESGVNLAAYRLEDAAPGASWSETINLRPHLPGEVAVTVTADPIDPNLYRVAAVGRSDGGPETKVSARYRKIRLRCAANFPVSASFTSNGDVCMSSAAVAGGITLENNSRVLDEVCAATYSAERPELLPPPDKLHPINLKKTWIPDPGAAASYASYVWKNGKKYSADPVPQVNGVVSTLLPLGPTLNNPAGIYRHVGNLTLQSDLIVTGTLVVEGSLILNGGASVIDATMPASKGFPALVVKGDLFLRNMPPARPQSLTVNGVASVAGVVGSKTTGRRTTVTVNGALVVGGGSIATTTTGVVLVNYVPTNNLDVRGLKRGSNLQLVSWVQGDPKSVN